MRRRSCGGRPGREAPPESAPPHRVARGAAARSCQTAAVRDRLVAFSRSRVGALAIGLAAGLCICAALPPWGWWPLAPVGIALWLFLLRGRSVRGRFAVGWLVGVGWFAPSTLWILQLTPPGYVAGVLLFWGPLMGLVAAACPPDRRRYLVLPALLTLTTWALAHAPFGGVPLSELAMSQTRAPLLPVARVGGGLMLTGAVAALGSALALTVARRTRPALGILAAIVALAVAGVVWPTGAPGVTERVVGVQGGGPQGTRFQSGQAPIVFRRHLELTREIDGPVDLVVWPENAINVDGDFEDHPWRDLIAAEAERIGAPIMVGVVADAGPERFVNYVVVVNPDGTLVDRYDKERRVPFGEYVPLRPVVEPIGGAALPPRDQIPGNELREGNHAVVQTSAGPIAVAISWEIFFSRRVREGVREGGQILTNPTNGASYWLTIVQSQQVAATQLRAVEAGRWTLQISPTGFSAFVSPSGDVSQRTSVSERALLAADLPRSTRTTPARALGDVPALLVAAGALVVAGALSPRRLRRRDVQGSDLEQEGDGAVVDQ
jgi:apolipoprotein N-acyltransferase